MVTLRSHVPWWVLISVLRGRFGYNDWVWLRLDPKPSLLPAPRAGWLSLCLVSLCGSRRAHFCAGEPPWFSPVGFGRTCGFLAWSFDWRMVTHRSEQWGQHASSATFVEKQGASL
eukprot:1811925-Amphidinium_carterae.1